MNIVKLAIKRPIFILMITLFMIALGLISLQRLPVDLYPDISYPMLAVRTDLSGAAPEEIEQIITKRMEEELSTLPGLQTLRSMSRTGTSMVFLEFDMNTDIRFQEIQVRGKVGNLKKSLPEQVTDPVVFRQDPDDTPIIEISVTGNRAASEISDIADDIIGQKIRQINGVGSVDLYGTRKEIVAVELKPEALDFWKINAREVVTAIQRYNRNDPVGKIEGEKLSWLIRSISQAEIAKDLGNIGIKKTSQGSVFLRDIATITKGYSEVTRVVRFGRDKEVKPAVMLQVLKQSGENTVQISDRVQEALKEITSQLPDDIDVTITRDNAELIRSNVADVYETLIIGAILTILVVLIFLRSPRSTITTGISLPSSVITTFAIMYAAGFTVNIMTLLGLSLVIGLLVDDAIVVRENIVRHLQKGEEPAKKAVQHGTLEVAIAVVATTLTIIAVFLPVGFMGGVTGQLFKQFALTVVFAILISTWDAMTMAPMLSAYYANIADPVKEWTKFGKIGEKIHGVLHRFEMWFDRVAEKYGRLVNYLLDHPFVVGGAAAAALVTALLGFLFINTSFLPAQLGDTFNVNISGPVATPVDEAIKIGAEIENRVKDLKEIENWTINAGISGTGDAHIRLMIRVAEKYAKNQTTLSNVRQVIRTALADIPGYTVRVSEPADPLAGSTGRYQPIALVVSGEDIGVLTEVAQQARRVLVGIPGVTDVAPIQDRGLPEIKLKVDPELSSYYGIDPATVADNLQIWVEGNTTNKLRSGDDQIDIRVRLKDGDKLQPEELMAKNFYIASNNQTVSVPLSNLVTKEAGASPRTINRENRERIMRIGGNIAKDAALGTIISQLSKELENLALPRGYSVRIDGQKQQMEELFSNLIIAILLGVLFVYMILAALFESFLQPLSVLTAIPLAVTGAIWALIFTGRPLDLYAGIGMILLAGIVAKNSILLVDFAMQRVRELKMDPLQAIKESAPLRLRPIIMTSVAIIAGMLPVAIGMGSGGAARQPLGIATIGGVISSTFLTLLIVPSLYVAIERFSSKAKKLISKRF